mmetsp:Transcript_32194/g.46911  ORF Transcript_32194/g.46911 Transcript_32194/m.46911 type:complete len:470 (-) Transcript_32194:93-1502(-)
MRVLLFLSVVPGLVAASAALSFSSPLTHEGKSIVSNKKVVVVGGGPVALYFAALMSHLDPTVQIEILEKRTQPSVNAFGLGVSKRMQHRLRDVPGLLEQAIAISAPIDALGIPLVSRDDLTQQMGSFVSDNFGKNCRLALGEECTSVDFEGKTVTTGSGRVLKYDLLLGADGVNSKIRQWLIEDSGDDDIKEEHYLEDAYWKTLQLPKQPDIEAGSFKPLHHPSLGGGRVLPKAPEGHILLLFWTDKQRNYGNIENPKGIETVDDLKQMIMEAMQDKKKSGIFSNIQRKLLGINKGENIKKDRQVVFNEVALSEFLSAHAGRSHHLQVNKYHSNRGSVALIGDSAHAFNSLLGQGCNTGLQSTHALVESLMRSNSTLEDAMEDYTAKATKESYAITELSLINYAIKGGFMMTLRVVPLILWNMLRGRGLIKRIEDVSVPFSQIAAENKQLLKLCRRQFQKKRRPYSRDN